MEIHHRRDSAPIACPDCGAETSIVVLGTLELDLCDACGGVWFDRTELERLPKEVDPAELSGEIHALAVRLARRKRTPKAYPSCPVCQASMNPTQYRKASGVALHRCRGCGVWLDGDQAAKFFALFEQGHLPELEERATKATHDDLEARIAKLETASRLAPSVPFSTAPAMSGAHRSGLLLGSVFAFLASLLDE